MKLTTKSEYSLLALIYIARYGKNNFIKSEDICKKYGLSKKYLEQIFYILKNNRYIKTKRGINGGYSLAVSAKKITVAEIIRLMDGALAPTESVSKYFFSHTPLEKEVKIINILREIRNFIAKRLEKFTLADLI
jgi:Rrf2 family transcriptional regulator, cysteine metabolism repressor